MARTVAYPDFKTQRENARAQGLVRFTVSAPCKYGHVAERYVSSGNCVECAAARFVSQYKASRREQHELAARERAARSAAIEAQVDFYDSSKPCKNGHVGQRFAADACCVICARATALRWYHKHGKARYADNPTPRLRSNSVWRKNNPDIVRKLKRVSEAARRAKKLASGGRFSRHDVAALFDQQHGRCASCHSTIADGYEIDHVKPLALGGSNRLDNIQLLCPQCNRSKSAKDPLVWARDNGRLL